MKNFRGVIIEESLEKKDVLKKISILKTDVEPVTENHKTPWVKQWTLHTIEIPADQVDIVADDISKDLDKEHNWYADFKNDEFHYIIFTNKVFKIDRSKPDDYQKATDFGITIGIPDYQLDFSSHIEEWKRDNR